MSEKCERCGGKRWIGDPDSPADCMVCTGRREVEQERVCAVCFGPVSGDPRICIIHGFAGTVYGKPESGAGNDGNVGKLLVREIERLESVAMGEALEHGVTLAHTESIEEACIAAYAERNRLAAEVERLRDERDKDVALVADAAYAERDRERERAEKAEADRVFWMERSEAEMLALREERNSERERGDRWKALAERVLHGAGAEADLAFDEIRAALAKEKQP